MKTLGSATGSATFWAEELVAVSKTKFNGVGDYECTIAGQFAVIKITKANEKQLTLSKEALKRGWKVSGGNCYAWTGLWTMLCYAMLDWTCYAGLCWTMLDLLDWTWV